MTIPRVAIIAVHGAADQKAGDTARAVAGLLMSSAPAGARYTSTSTRKSSVEAVPLEPKPDSVPEAERASPPTPRGQDRSLRKSLAQSLRSDFQAHGWAAPATPEDATPDRGIAFTNYLLAKNIRNGADVETFEASAIQMQRRTADGGATPGQADASVDADADVTAQVDVYDMLWADLSRQSGAVPQLVSELLTMVFRPAKLGREMVDDMRGQLARLRDPQARFARTYATAWSVVASLQVALDWLFINGLVLLFGQLVLLDLLLVGLSYTSGLSQEQAMDANSINTLVHQSWLHRGVAIALPCLALMRLVYSRGSGRRVQAVALWSLVVVPLGALLLMPSALQWITTITMIALLTVANEWLLRIADDRFPMVLTTGRWMWGLSGLVMLASALHEVQVVGTVSWRELWIHAALFASETVMLAINDWWVLVGPLLVVWYLAGEVARREARYASRASITLGRLGLTVSLCMFLLATMVAWSQAGARLGESASGVGYRPCIAASVPSARALPSLRSATPNVCLWTSSQALQAAATTPMPTALAVLSDTYARKAGVFAPLVALLLLLAAYVLALLVPSIFAEQAAIIGSRLDAHELALTRQRVRPGGVPPGVAAGLRQSRARDLGQWLSAGYRRLDLVVNGVSLLAVLFSLVLATAYLSNFVDSASARQLINSVPALWLASMAAARSLALPDIFDSLSTVAVYGIAGFGALLAFFGPQLSRHMPSLRGPLDIALDVDNYFREFPRIDIPRARIFSRYAALLAHVQSQDYERIVIVSHSQGTVISADLLRFLSSRRQCAPSAADVPLVGAKPLPPISLLTLGCPLRQLYGARFPGLYGWVLKLNGATVGPRARDLGVQRWMNAFCSGDYIGRWLWSQPTPGKSAERAAAFGQVDPMSGMRSVDKVPPSAREIEVNLGLGGHTRYLDPDRSDVGGMIDFLVHARPPQGVDGAVASDQAEPVRIATVSALFRESAD